MENILSFVLSVFCFGIYVCVVALECSLSHHICFYLLTPFPVRADLLLAFYWLRPRISSGCRSAFLYFVPESLVYTVAAKTLIQYATFYIPPHPGSYSERGMCAGQKCSCITIKVGAMLSSPVRGAPPSLRGGAAYLSALMLRLLLVIVARPYCRVWAVCIWDVSCLLD